jgi:hypothetical protein
LLQADGHREGLDAECADRTEQIETTDDCEQVVGAFP